MVLEVEVPHPALLYKKALKWSKKSLAEQMSLLTPPPTLADFGIESAKDVTPQNANKVAAAYGITIQPYEEETEYVAVDIPTTTVENKTYSQSQSLDTIIIPDGFVAEELTCSGSVNYQTSSNASAYIQFSFSGHKVSEKDLKGRSTITDRKSVV